MSEDLVIIHPNAAARTYEQLADTFAAVEPPLWARLIAGYIRDRAYSVQIIDAEAYDMSPVAVASKTVYYRPKLVCIAAYGHQPSASTQSMSAVYETARALKKANPHLPIIVVGGHVSAIPERTLNEEAAIDFICVGEGPVTILGLLYSNSHESVPGLAYRISATPWVCINPSASLLDPKELHGNVWDLLPMDKYRAHNWQCLDDFSKRKPYASIYTTLGCPYSCHFCCIHAPFESRRYRMRDPVAVVSEIRHLYRMGVRTFKITDEMFLLNERHYTDIAKGLINLGISNDLNIWAYARIDTIKSHTLKMLRKAGIRWLALGIESGSKLVRDGADKAFSQEDIVANVQAIRDAGINVIANYIFGLPDDDMDTMRATLDLALQLNTEWANFYSAMAYPGSPLYGQAIREGWKLPVQWSGYSQHSLDCRPLDTRYVSGAAVLAFRDEAFQTYFDRPIYKEMIQDKFGLLAVGHVQAMLKHRLRRDLIDNMALA